MTKFVALSGTVMDRAPTEFGHLLRWCLGEGAPIPRTVEELDEWSAALDEDVEEWRRWEPGALLDLASAEERESLPALNAARRGFQRRLVETPGVVATTHDGEHVEASIYIRPITYKMTAQTDAHFAKLRKEMLTPDDWDVTPVDVWRHARELALGYHQIWDPRPSVPWRRARRAWFSFVRAILSRSRTLDSPEHVEQACDAGSLSCDELAAWRAAKVEPFHPDGRPFVPNEVPVWHDESALKVIVDWMKKPGLVWVSHVPVGERLREITGAPYFREGGFDDEGRYIEDWDPRHGAIIVSKDANKEGKDLQKKWSRNFIATPLDSAREWQQLIGRTHRPGQLADEVTFDVMLGCVEHDRAMRKALSSAAAVREMTGAPQKLLLADTSAWPEETELATFRGARWR